jgi:hypothetical protein
MFGLERRNSPGRIQCRREHMSDRQRELKVALLKPAMLQIQMHRSHHVIAVKQWHTDGVSKILDAVRCGRHLMIAHPNRVTLRDHQLGERSAQDHLPHATLGEHQLRFKLPVIAGPQESRHRRTEFVLQHLDGTPHDFLRPTTPEQRDG